MKKRIVKKALVGLIALGMILGSIVVPKAKADNISLIENVAIQTPIANENAQNYEAWSNVVKSYMQKTATGFMRVAANATADLIIEYYDEAYQFQSAQKLTAEMPIFGGFYEGSNAFYVVWGQNNLEDSDAVEVMRVVKYDKNWNRLSAANVFGSNTYKPFSAGSLRMTECDGYLYIRTCHGMYKSSDGKHHQACMTFEFQESDMAKVDSYYKIMNITCGYVSHSFNQFIMVDSNKNLVALDHGDAYPRSAVLGKYKTKAGLSTGFQGAYGTYSNINTVTYQGAVGANATYASIGGLNESSTQYITAGNTIDQSQTYTADSVRNIYITATSKGKFTTDGTKFKWITTYKKEDGTVVSTPHLVKVGTDNFMLLWSEKSSTGTKVAYVYLDEEGNTLGDIVTIDGVLSDCAPIFSGNKVFWYSSNSKIVTFYSIDTEGKFIKTVKTFNIVYELNGGSISENAAKTFTSEDIKNISLEKPTKAGNDFAGWYFDGKFSNEVLSDKVINGEKVSDEYYLDPTSYSSDITVFAKWVLNDIPDVVIPLKNQTITVVTTKTYKAKNIKKKPVTFNLGAKTDGDGKLTYKITRYPKNAKKYILVDKVGKVTLKKGTAKGTYKIAVVATKTLKYKAAAKTVTILVK